MTSIANCINLFDLKGWSNENYGLGLIKKKIQLFGILPPEIECIRGYTMQCS